MKEIPMLFSPPMVRAIQSGRKFQTRRICKPQPVYDIDSGYVYIANMVFDIHDGWDIPMYLKDIARYAEGDILWVRETFYAYGHWTLITTTGMNSIKKEWHFHDLTGAAGKCYMYEDSPPPTVIKGRLGLGYFKRPSIFMPKEASRIKLLIIRVLAQRLQDISGVDAIEEGIEFSNPESGVPMHYHHEFKDYLRNDFEVDALGSYMTLWDSINGKGAWDKNPWVYSIQFLKQA